METLMLLILFPLIWPFIAKRIWHRDISWAEVAINIFGVVVLVCIIWFTGTMGKVYDTQLWNGQVVSKTREHDTYLESYRCRCHTVCRGSGSSRSCTQSCDTCYRRHYTVTWFAMIDLGWGKNHKLVFDHKDSTFRWVYDSEDPVPYVNCKEGEPATVAASFDNYIKAVPDSLFNMEQTNASYLDKVPNYPNIYGFYKVNRVLNVDSGLPSTTITDLNNRLSEHLKVLGPKHRVNVIVIVTNIKDPSFRYAVENKWVGGKQNDSVVMIGVDGDKIIWADVMTFALNKGNELYHVTLRDAIMDLKVVDSQKMADTIASVTDDKFDRISMADFEYLKARVQPPEWAIILAAFLAIFGSIGLSFVMTRVDIRFDR